MNDAAAPDQRPESYFDFITRWLADQPARTATGFVAGGMKPKRRVTRELANFTRNRICSGRADWQPARWFARDKLTDSVVRVRPTYHDDGIQGLAGENRRLILAHTHGDRLRLRATLAFLNARVDDQFLTERCYGSRPNGTQKCTDRGAALRCFRQLVWDEGLRWVAKLDVKKFYDRLRHRQVLAALAAAIPDRGCYREIEGYLAWYLRESWPGHLTLSATPQGLPQGSPVSGVLANIFMTEFDKALIAAGVEHIRYLDDVSIMAHTPQELTAHLDLAMSQIAGLGLTLATAKTRVAFLDDGPPRLKSLTLAGCGETLRVDREFDLLGVHFYGDGQFRARQRTVARLLSRVRRIIIRDRGVRSPVRRYIAATAAINGMLGYYVGHRRPGSRPLELLSLTVAGGLPIPRGAVVLNSVGWSPSPGRRSKARSRRDRLRQKPRTTILRRISYTKLVTGFVWIAGMRFVQPRQHALLGYSSLVVAQLQRVDRLIRRWMKAEFEQVIATATQPPGLQNTLRNRRVRSAVKMYEMAAREPPPTCPGGFP